MMGSSILHVVSVSVGRRIAKNKKQKTKNKAKLHEKLQNRISNYASDAIRGGICE
jgi:hypothetical protein